jgi:histidinol dehydrogenase
VRAYHERQLEACGRSWSYRDEDGTLLGQKVTPLDRVGIYVPGGKAAYPSSVLMNAIPAKVAGVGEIVMVVPTPVRKDASSTTAGGEKNPLVLAAAHVSGVDRVFTIGGAQAVAAWPTARPRAQGRQDHRPGNACVASAKKHVLGRGHDMIAGPEILVLADGSTPPDWWRWTFSARPSTTAGAEHPAVSRCRHRAGEGRDRPPAARHAAARRHCARSKAAAR